MEALKQKTAPQARVAQRRRTLPSDTTYGSPARTEFLTRWRSLMQQKQIPIYKNPTLGFKEIDLYSFYQGVQNLGGYEEVTHRRLWKRVYCQLGCSPNNTSAATFARRHYERLLLPFERHRNEEKERRQASGNRSMVHHDVHQFGYHKVLQQKTVTNAKPDTGLTVQLLDSGQSKPCPTGRSTITQSHDGPSVLQPPNSQPAQKEGVTCQSPKHPSISESPSDHQTKCLSPVAPQLDPPSQTGTLVTVHTSLHQPQMSGLASPISDCQKLTGGVISPQSDQHLADGKHRPHTVGQPPLTEGPSPPNTTVRGVRPPPYSQQMTDGITCQRVHTTTSTTDTRIQTLNPQKDNRIVGIQPCNNNTKIGFTQVSEQSKLTSSFEAEDSCQNTRWKYSNRHPIETRTNVEQERCLNIPPAENVELSVGRVFQSSNPQKIHSEVTLKPNNMVITERKQQIEQRFNLSKETGEPSIPIHSSQDKQAHSSPEGTRPSLTESLLTTNQPSKNNPSMNHRLLQHLLSLPTSQNRPSNDGVVNDEIKQTSKTSYSGGPEQRRVKHHPYQRPEEKKTDEVHAMSLGDHSLSVRQIQDVSHADRQSIVMILPGNNIYEMKTGSSCLPNYSSNVKGNHPLTWGLINTFRDNSEGGHSSLNQRQVPEEGVSQQTTKTPVYNQPGLLDDMDCDVRSYMADSGALNHHSVLREERGEEGSYITTGDLPPDSSLNYTQGEKDIFQFHKCEEYQRSLNQELQGLSQNTTPDKGGTGYDNWIANFDEQKFSTTNKNSFNKNLYHSGTPSSQLNLTNSGDTSESNSACVDLRKITFMNQDLKGDLCRQQEKDRLVAMEEGSPCQDQPMDLNISRRLSDCAADLYQGPGQSLDTPSADFSDPGSTAPLNLVTHNRERHLVCTCGVNITQV